MPLNTVITIYFCLIKKLQYMKVTIHKVLFNCNTCVCVKWSYVEYKLYIELHATGFTFNYASITVFDKSE